MNLKEQYREYLEISYSNQNTIKQYQRLSQHFFKTTKPLTQKNINEFFKRYKNITTNRGFISSILRCFKKQIKQQQLDIELPEKRSQDKTEDIHLKFLKIEEIHYLIKNLSPGLSIRVRVMFETGLRRDEIIYLKKKDINTENRSLKIKGKRKKVTILQYSKELAKQLDVYLKNFNNEDLPFSYPNVAHPSQKLWYLLKKEAEELGIEGLHPHKIRHSLGHHLRADKNFDLEQVRERLRHADVSTTQIYSTATKEEVDKKMDEEVFPELNKALDGE